MRTRVAVVSVIVASGVFGVAPAAFADGPGYSPPPAVSDVCNAGHGAFAAFSQPNQHFTPGQPPYFGDGQLGSARAGGSGDVNSSYSASCRVAP